MSSSMFKLNPEKTEFIIFGSHAQLKKLDSYLPVRTFGNFLHPSGVWFDANLSFGDHVRNICKTCFIQLCDLRWVRQYLTDDAAVLAANVLVSSRLDHSNSLFKSLSSFNMRKLQLFKTHLVELSQIAIDTQRLLLFSKKNSIGCQLNFGVFSKLPLWFVSFFRVLTHVISALVCLFIVDYMAQDKNTQKFL